MADVKGDLTGVAEEGTSSKNCSQGLKISASMTGNHMLIRWWWDIFGEKGHPVRATVSDLGPLLLARLLNLNDVQSGVLDIIFRIADDQGLLLLDFKDLRAITQYIGDNANPSRISTVISVAHRLVPSSAGCCRWNNKAQHTFWRADAGYQRLDAHRCQQ